MTPTLFSFVQKNTSFQAYGVPVKQKMMTATPPHGAFGWFGSFGVVLLDLIFKNGDFWSL